MSLGGFSSPAVQRVHEVFKPKCPVYRSIHRAIDLTTELRLLGAAGSVSNADQRGR
jgi:hypothetical protein